MRKRIGIETFLKWAYRDELPKAQCDGGAVSALGPASFGGAWGGVEAVGTLGALVDYARENRFGVVPDRYARDDPHPDAVLAALAMERLDSLDLCMPHHWNPIPDLGEVGQIDRTDLEAGRLGYAAVQEALADLTVMDAQGQRTLKGGLRRLVMRYAVLNGEPGWEIETPVVEVVCVGKGRPGWFRREIVQGVNGPYEVETDGFDRKRRLPFPDAYRKHRLEPSPVEGIYDRGQHEIYVAALHVLHADLEPRLRAYALTPPERPARPWETGAMAKPRILLGQAPALVTAEADPTPAPETPFAAPTGLTRAQRGPVRKNSAVRRTKVA